MTYLRSAIAATYIVAAVVSGCQATGAGQAQVVQVGLWDRFEATVPNTAGYADPFSDVSLDVTYTRPDGSTIEFWGFYDGGNTWKIRFMPDQPGAWRYEARFSDGSPGASGAFEVAPSGIPGMISQEEENPIWFGFKGGEHVLVRSFHVGDRFFASNWDPASRAAFLGWAQEQGYNMLSIPSHYLNRDAEGRGEGWDTPDLWPLDASEYGRMEAVLDDLAERRIMVYPFAGFFGKNSDFPTDEADQERYIRYTLARLGPYWNLLFNVAGPEPLLRNSPYLTEEEVNALGRQITRLDVFGHLLSVHNWTGDDPFRDQDWLTFGTLQGPKTIDLSELSETLHANHHPRKPLYAQETLWSGNENHIRPIGRDYTDDELRKNAFVIHMSGVALNFADNDGNSSSGFSGTLDLGDRKQHRHDVIMRIWDFFETVPFYQMRPRQDLVSSGYALAEEGRQYLVYLPEGGTVDVQLDGGVYTVTWINAQDTPDRRPGAATRTGKQLTAPTDGDDWLVYLVRSDD